MIWLSPPSRFVVIAFCVAVSGVSPTATAAAEADNAAGELDGTWKLVSVEQDGDVMVRDDDVLWVVKGGEVLFAGEVLATMAIYAASAPKGLDLAFRSPKNDYEGIYALVKDELRICLNTNTTGAKDRPADFATQGKTNLRVLKFERVAPDAAGPGTVRGYVGMALAVENERAAIQGVLVNSPAEKAGLKIGDVLVSLGGQEAKDLQSTVDVVRRQKPGNELVLRVLRDGKEKEIAVRVAVFPFSLLGILG